MFTFTPTTTVIPSLVHSPPPHFIMPSDPAPSNVVFPPAICSSPAANCTKPHVSDLIDYPCPLLHYPPLRPVVCDLPHHPPTCALPHCPSFGLHALLPGEPIPHMLVDVLIGLTIVFGSRSSRRPETYIFPVVQDAVFHVTPTGDFLCDGVLLRSESTTRNRGVDLYLRVSPSPL